MPSVREVVAKHHWPAVAWAVTVLVGGSAAIWTAASLTARLDAMDAHIAQRATETERVLSLRIDAERESADRRIADTDRRVERVEGRVWPGAMIGRDAGVPSPRFPYDFDPNSPRLAVPPFAPALVQHGPRPPR